MTSPIPALSKILPIATPAAPTPAMTTVRSSIFLPVIFNEFHNAANVTTAVPCWSSWNTGMSRLARRRSSISKHSGALMSSRLIPPNVGAIRCTKSTTSSAVRALIQIGNPFTPPNSLNSRALPSMTGIAPSGPMSPSPSTAVPLLTMATVFLRMVYLCESEGSFSIAVQTRATPGV